MKYLTDLILFTEVGKISQKLFLFSILMWPELKLTRCTWESYYLKTKTVKELDTVTTICIAPLIKAKDLMFRTLDTCFTILHLSCLF